MMDKRYRYGSQWNLATHQSNHQITAHAQMVPWIVHVKNRLPEEKKKDMVYIRSPMWGDCEQVYIGDTGRPLQKMVTKYKMAVN